jgi:sulfate transport system ATP-binding protein
MSIQFEQVTKRYRGIPVVNDLTLEIPKGEFFVLLGPSGSGKSTLLRGVAGLTRVDHGRIALHGRDVTFLSPRERGVGFVFQHYALFRNMTVAENIEFALRVRRMRGKKRRERRQELLRLVALDGMDDRLPSQLSGGQQQRVAVARALAHEPEVLLLDEPFGALDAKIRAELRRTVRDVQRRLGTTTILVTHDQEEAFALADRIGVMHMGRLLETGRPDHLYRRPATRFVATFLGAANLLLGEVVPPRIRIGSAFLPRPSYTRASAGAGSEIVTVVRPEDLELAAQQRALTNPCVGDGTVIETNFGGGIERLIVQIGAAANLRSASRPDAQPGNIAVPAGACLLEVTRTAAESAAMTLRIGQHVAVGIRRAHVLPTPVSSFLFRAATREAVEDLRRSPLVAQLVQSTQANLAETIVSEESPAGDLRNSGVVIVDSEGRTPEDLADLVSKGASRLLCVPRGGPLPRRVVIYCPTVAPQAETMGLVASLIRHINAEATFVTVLAPEASAGERAAAIRRLLDTRADVRAGHGLDLRTEVREGDVAAELRDMIAGPDPAMLVVGISGARAQVGERLAKDLSWVLSRRAPCPLLITHDAVRAQLSAVV